MAGPAPIVIGNRPPPRPNHGWSSPQQAYSHARRVFADDILSFNPWHCVDAHRPLGSIMRARIKAYDASSAFRHERNDRPRIEIDDIAQVPD